MNNIAIRINYKQSGISDINSKYIYQIKEELKDIYILNLRPNAGPQAGGLLDIVLEVITNVDLKTFITILRDGLLFDTVTRGKDSFILKPLFDTLSNIEESTICWDYSHVSLTFDDTKIYIYGIDNLFTSKIHIVLNMLEKIYTKLNINELGFPYEIVIPIEKQFDENGNHKFVNEEPLKDYDIGDYTKYWGLSFDLGNTKKTLDLEKGIILDDEWELSWYL